jgi:hypothetical protein
MEDGCGALRRPIGRACGTEEVRRREQLWEHEEERDQAEEDTLEWKESHAPLHLIVVGIQSVSRIGVHVVAE